MGPSVHLREPHLAPFSPRSQVKVSEINSLPSLYQYSENRISGLISQNSWQAYISVVPVGNFVDGLIRVRSLGSIPVANVIGPIVGPVGSVGLGVSVGAGVSMMIGIEVLDSVGVNVGIIVAV